MQRLICRSLGCSSPLARWSTAPHRLCTRLAVGTSGVDRGVLSPAADAATGDPQTNAGRGGAAQRHGSRRRRSANAVLLSVMDGLHRRVAYPLRRRGRKP